MQDGCIGTYMAMWFAASIPLSPTSDISPHVIPPPPPHPCPAVPPLAPCNRPQYVMLPSLCPCVLIVQHLPLNKNMWCVIFVLVSVCWERWFPNSSMFLQRKQTHHFLWLHSYSMVYLCHIFLVHSIINGHLGWFQVFAIVNSAAMNICVHVSL